MSNIIAQTTTPAAPAAPAPAAPAAPAAATTATTTQSTETAPKEAQQEQQGGGWTMLVTFLLIGVIFYFIAIRPQLKQQKDLKKRQEGLKVGDKVITNAGIHGIIRDIKDRTILLEIASSTNITLEKSCIVSTVDKSTAAAK